MSKGHRDEDDAAWAYLPLRAKVVQLDHSESKLTTILDFIKEILDRI